jgi:hypothetical protein
MCACGGPLLSRIFFSAKEGGLPLGCGRRRVDGFSGQAGRFQFSSTKWHSLSISNLNRRFESKSRLVSSAHPLPHPKPLCPRPPTTAPTSADDAQVRIPPSPLPFFRSSQESATQIQMCHRHLSFKKSSACGHLILTGEHNVDCQDPECYNSSAHPPDCATRSGHGRCWCRRYYTCVPFPASDNRSFHSSSLPRHASQPERVVKPGQVSFLSYFPPRSSRSINTPPLNQTPSSCQTNALHVPLVLPQ